MLRIAYAPRASVDVTRALDRRGRLAFGAPGKGAIEHAGAIQFRQYVFSLFVVQLAVRQLMKK
jgi:hypothetical protein